MAEYSHKGKQIEVEITADTTPQRAWEAWADPEKLAGWFVDEARGEGKTGGTMVWVFERFNMEIPYRVIDSVPGEKIVFGPASDEMPPFVLEVTIQREEGETRIRLVNSGFSDDGDFESQFEGIDSGWRMAMGILKEYLENHFGESKTMFMATRPAEFEYPELQRYFVDGKLLAKWLGSGPGVGAEGSAIQLQLQDGGTLTGRVLAQTTREVALSWDEIDGICELKAFDQGPQKMLCIRGWGWGMDPGEAQRLEEQMGNALDRLAEQLPVRA